MSWDLVLGFFPEEVQRLILDTSISDLMINGNKVDDVLYYLRGSQHVGIQKLSYAKVIATEPKENLLTVQKPDGTAVSYDPARLYGVSVYRELEREFSVGDRMSLTAPNRELGVANRDLGTLERIDGNGQLSVRMDSGKAVSFDTTVMRHLITATLSQVIVHRG